MNTKWWILDGEIVSAANSSGKPGNFQEATGPDARQDDLYFDGEAIQLRPERPSADYFWNKDHWEAEAKTPQMNVADWPKLLNALEPSDEWQKAQFAATTFSKSGLIANLAVTQLIAILTSTHDILRLALAIEALRGAMSQIAGVGDYTAEELENIRGYLDSAGVSADELDRVLEA